MAPERVATSFTRCASSSLVPFPIIPVTYRPEAVRAQFPASAPPSRSEQRALWREHTDLSSDSARPFSASPPLYSRTRTLRSIPLALRADPALPPSSPRNTRTTPPDDSLVLRG